MIHMHDQEPRGKYLSRSAWPRRLFWTAATVATLYMIWQALPRALSQALVMQ